MGCTAPRDLSTAGVVLGCSGGSRERSRGRHGGGATVECEAGAVTGWGFNVGAWLVACVRVGVLEYTPLATARARGGARVTRRTSGGGPP